MYLTNSSDNLNFDLSKNQNLKIDNEELALD